MTASKKYTFKKFLAIAVWIILCSGTVVLLVAAITKKNSEEIEGIEINIAGVKNNYFIDQKDVLKILVKANGKSLEKAVAGSLDLAEMENALQKDQWIKRAELFFDNKNVLQVKIIEREPVARIFTAAGSSFYLDSSLTRLPLSDKFSPRLPIFTNFPTEVLVLTKQDSLLLKGVKLLGEYIDADPFWMAQIDQVDITPERTFELVPKLGNQVIRFGTAAHYKEKFNKLLAFYKQVQTKTGWNKYSILDLQFKNQVVAVKRDAREIKMDSLSTIQIMKDIIIEAQKRTNDTTNVQLPELKDDNSKVKISPSVGNEPEKNLEEANVQRQENNNSSIALPVPVNPVKKDEEGGKAKPAVMPPPSEKVNTVEAKKPSIKKQVIKKELKKAEEKMAPPQEKVIEQPKAIMPPQSDY